MKLIFGILVLFQVAAMAGDRLILGAPPKVPFQTGLKQPLNWAKLAPWKNIEPPFGAPMNWDWRNEVKCVPAVKDQKQCGSCWAFGTTEVLEWAKAIDGVCEPALSPQEILACSGKGSCMGGYWAHAFQVKPGQSYETEMPYKASSFANCKASNLSHASKIKNWSYVGVSGKKPTTEQIKAAILQYGAVGVTVTANSAMQRYKGGVFGGNVCSKGYTNHIVVLIGWDDKTETWIMQNSWGKGWGEQGYMRIKYGCSRIGESTTIVDR